MQAQRVANSEKVIKKTRSGRLFTYNRTAIYANCYT